MTITRRRSALAQYLALAYALAVAYMSLQPFTPWVEPPAGMPYFLWQPSRVIRSDVILNLVAYLPLGFFLALLPRRAPAARRVALSLLLGGALSLVMESLQMYLPQRAASMSDLVSNALGSAAGGLLAVLFLRSARARHALADARERWFLPGRFGDLGLALVAVWLVVQVNPGIPLFATMFDPGTQESTSLANAATSGAPDFAAFVVEACHSAFQLLGVALFVAVLLRHRRHIGTVVLVLLVLAILVKSVAATIMLKPEAFARWLRPGVSTGVALGALLLTVAIWLPRPAQIAVAAVALLSSLLATILAPELIFTRPPLAHFDWSYGQLLNFNGLTHAVLLAWPVAASVFLFALSGRPAWGASE